MATGMREKTTNVGGIIKRIWYAMTGATQGPELMSVDENGMLGINGVKFPTTHIPNSDPNVLDDYEEGAWTPVVTALAGTIASYTINSAKYIKIGSLVNLSIDFTIVNKGTATGFLKCTTPYLNGSSYCILSGNERSITGAAISGAIAPADTFLSIIKYDGTDFIGNGYRYVITGSICVI